MDNKFDFSGWATRANLKCADGRVIMKDAFKNNDGTIVPLVWNHQHNHPDEILGHALLENREDGVYVYGTFNETESGKTAKLLVQNGDIDKLSIYANRLKHEGHNVVHGAIREVSLVLAGANPGAYIDTVMMHGEDFNEEGVIPGYHLENVESLFHSDEEEKGDEEVATETKISETLEHAEEAETKEETVMDVFDTLSEKQKTAVYAIIAQAMEDAADDEEVEHSDEDTDDSEETIEHAEAEDDAADDSEETVEDVFNTLNDKQKQVVYAMISTALEGDDDEEDDEVEHSEGGEDYMKHNVFDQDQEMMSDVLTHDEMKAIMADAKSCGSLKEAVLAHGIEEIEIMFPDHKNYTNEPEFIKRDDDWVAKVLGGVHHTPFSRIKTIFADITAAEARAKGYQKGNLKIEEVFKLLKRVTGPTTVYKKQKLDRDDMLDLADNFNLLPFLKKEIRMMLNEEMARAFLVGDGRDPVEQANDKINEECIRPIWKMEDLFTVKVPVAVAASATETDRAKAFIKACKKSRKLYKGSGNPTMFMPEDMLTDCLMIEDLNGREIYDTIDKLKAALRVSEIVPVPVMEGLSRTDDNGKTFELAAIYVNLKDYNVGTDKGGEINFFEDFDIDYNQQKYLMETRCSATLVKPYSAVAIEFTAEAEG